MNNLESICEITVVSGKGGTGKTTVTACFADLAHTPILADADVDAANLSLVLQPTIGSTKPFISGIQAHINQKDCIGCGDCFKRCRFNAITYSKKDHHVEYVIDSTACEGCGVCIHFCPAGAITAVPQKCGDCFISDTSRGPLAHAQLGIAAENSGKLVTEVRNTARHLANQHNRRLILIDGPPGVGCAATAAITGVSLVVIVTEPTVSGLHDLERITKLTSNFKIPTGLCINKWDINPDLSDKLELFAQTTGAAILGRICYDPAVTEAQRNAIPVTAVQSEAATDIKAVWENLQMWGESHHWSF